jgi:hypothetical protein
MKLSLIRPFFSLVALPEQELPDFTLITGLNGAGKTHLLKALHAGAAVADIAPSYGQDVRFFDWTSLAPRDEGDFSSETIRQERIGFFNQIKGLYDQPWGLRQLFTAASAAGVSGSLLSDVQTLTLATEAELAVFARAPATGATIKQAVDQAFTQFENNLMSQFQPLQREQLRSIAEISNRHILRLEAE